MHGTLAKAAPELEGGEFRRSPPRYLDERARAGVFSEPLRAAQSLGSISEIPERTVAADARGRDRDSDAQGAPQAAGPSPNRNTRRSVGMSAVKRDRGPRLT